MTARRIVHRSTGASTLALVASAVLAGVALTGCGDQRAAEQSPGGSGMTSSASPTGPVEVTPVDGSLTVVLDDGTGTRQTWELGCSVAGGVTGDHPDAQNACAAIGAAGDPWAPVPGDMACTMIYGGPQTATVRGTWDGVAVDATFDRTDGCEISRWDRVAPLLQPGTTAGAASGAA